METIITNEQLSLIKKGAKLYRELDDMKISFDYFNLEMKRLFKLSGFELFSIFDSHCYNYSF
jgi:hypothetical protein